MREPERRAGQSQGVRERALVLDIVDTGLIEALQENGRASHLQLHKQHYNWGARQPACPVDQPEQNGEESHWAG